MSVKIKKEPGLSESMDVDSSETPTAAQSEVNNKALNGDGVRIKCENEKAVNDDPDPIVNEIPVYLAKSLDQKLFMLQYPVRPSTMPYKGSTVVGAKFKPEQKQVQLELALDTSSANFNKSKAEQIAVNVDGKGNKRLSLDDGDQELKYPSGMMDKQVLISTKAVDTAKRYAVGIMTNQELHLTPLEAILTLRTSLGHLDLSDKSKRESSKQNQDEDEDDPPSGDTNDVKPVTVKFAKSGTEAEKFKNAREKTFEFQQQKAAQELWVDMQFHDVRSPMWAEETQKLFCKDSTSQTGSVQADSKSFLDSIK